MKFELKLNENETGEDMNILSITNAFLEFIKEYNYSSIKDKKSIDIKYVWQLIKIAEEQVTNNMEFFYPKGENL